MGDVCVAGGEPRAPGFAFGAVFGDPLLSDFLGLVGVGDLVEADGAGDDCSRTGCCDEARDG